MRMGDERHTEMHRVIDKNHARYFVWVSSCVEARYQCTK
jgi:hypothetical protein